MKRRHQANSAARATIRPGKRFVTGLMVCIFAAGVSADSGERQSPLPEQAAKNRQGMTHFKQAVYDHMPKGRKAEANAQLRLAEEAFIEALEIDSDSIDAHRNLARLYFLQRKFRQAATEYDHVIRLNPKGIDTYVHMALAQIEMGDFDAAVQYLETAKTQTDDERIIQQLNSYIAKARQAGPAQ